MQVIRSDNGTKYTSERFIKFSEDAGINTSLLLPTLVNSVERKNRKIMEMTRCLLHDKGLAKKSGLRLQIQLCFAKQTANKSLVVKDSI